MKTRLAPEATGIIIPRVGIHGPSGIVEVNMILDTGAAYTMINRTTAEKVGYRIGHARKKVQIVTANGRIWTPFVHIQKISLGDISASHVPAIIHDLPGIIDIEGLIGLSLLKHFRTVMDYRKLTLHIG